VGLTGCCGGSDGVLGRGDTMVLLQLYAFSTDTRHHPHVGFRAAEGIFKQDDHPRPQSDLRIAFKGAAAAGRVEVVEDSNPWFESVRIIFAAWAWGNREGCPYGGCGWENICRDEYRWQVVKVKGWTV